MVHITIRESGINDDRSTVAFMHSFEIVSDDGRALYYIRLSEDGTLDVSCGGHVKHGGKMLAPQVVVRPHSTNVVSISRDVFEG